MYESMIMFAAVVEHKSLNRAARVLNVSQPALSRKISKLEEELDVKLFDRVGKKLVLTEAGITSYEYAQDMIRLDRRFKQSLQRFRPTRKIRLTLGASLTTLQSTLPDFIAHMIRHLPDADLKTITGKTHEIVAMVKEQKVHFGIVASQISRNDLVSLPLFNDHLCLVLPSGHALLQNRDLTIDALNELPMILFSKGTWYRIMMDELFARHALHPDIKMEIDSFEAIIRLITTCRAATLLPKSYLRDSVLSDNHLAVATIAELNQTIRTTSLIYNKAADMDWLESFFLDTQTYFREHHSL